MTKQALDLDTIVLLKGNHRKREHGLCIMEAVAYFAGLPHSDHPECTSLTRFAMNLVAVAGPDEAGGAPVQRS